MGTSMASPHVAGVAALIVGAGVRKPDAVEEILLGTARKPKGHAARPAARVDDHYGAGIVDARRGAAGRRATAAARASSGLAGAVALLGIVADAAARARVERLGLGLRGRAGRRLVRAVLPARPAAAVVVARARGRRGAVDGLHRTSAGALGRGVGNPLRLQRRRCRWR